MKFDPLKYLRDYSIPHYTEGKNVGEGWIGVGCPMCGDNSSHGGFNIEGGYYSCWKCGGISITKIIMALENISYAEAKKRFEEYSTYSPTPLDRKYFDVGPKTDNIQYPTGTTSIKEQHKKYLHKRGFDPDLLVEKYGILGTGPISHLKVGDAKINYSHRIIIPVIYNNKVVSFQGRDITGRSELRYRTCHSSAEVIHHKHILYNLDNCEDTAVIMEGALDVCRWGDGGVGTFGIQFTDEQILCLLGHRIKRGVIIYDPDKNAQRQAKKLLTILKDLYGIACQNYVLEGKDPAELTEKEIWKIKINLKI